LSVSIGFAEDLDRVELAILSQDGGGSHSIKLFGSDIGTVHGMARHQILVHFQDGESAVNVFGHRWTRQGALQLINARDGMMHLLASGHSLGVSQRVLIQCGHSLQLRQGLVVVQVTRLMNELGRFLIQIGSLRQRRAAKGNGIVFRNGNEG